MNILIPMCGLGKRFIEKGYTEPKPLIKIFDKTMIEWAIDSLGIKGNYIFVIKKEFNNLDKILTKLVPNCKIVVLDKNTNGAAETCLEAKHFLDYSDELIITNCDQIMNWNPKEFLEFIKNPIDGAVVTYYADTIKNSYARIDKDGYVDLIKEKEVISNYSLNGIHYWKQARLFVRSATRMIMNNDRTNNEFYIAPTYNYLIKDGYKIKVYNINSKEHIPIGTPEDLEKFKNEYNKI